MSKRPDVRRATNGPPMRRRSKTTNVRTTGFFPGTRPPPPRTYDCWRKDGDASTPLSWIPTQNSTATTLPGNASTSMRQWKPPTKHETPSLAVEPLQQGRTPGCLGTMVKSTPVVGRQSRATCIAAGAQNKARRRSRTPCPARTDSRARSTIPTWRKCPQTGLRSASTDRRRRGAGAAHQAVPTSGPERRRSNNAATQHV